MECSRQVLIHGWYNLQPFVIFFEDVNESELEDFKISKRKKFITGLLDYAGGFLYSEAQLLDQKAAPKC